VETGFDGLRPPPCNPRKPAWFPGFEKPATFSAFSGMSFGLRETADRCFGLFGANWPANLCAQNSVSRIGPMERGRWKALPSH